MPETSIDQAAQRFNAANPIDFKRANRQCPICNHRHCFGPLPNNPTRWACFSSNHPPNIGIKGSACFTGDALDIAAHHAGRDRIEHLRALGYLDRASTGAPGKRFASRQRNPKSQTARAPLPRFLPPPPPGPPIPQHPD